MIRGNGNGIDILSTSYNIIAFLGIGVAAAVRQYSAGLSIARTATSSRFDRCEM